MYHLGQGNYKKLDSDAQALFQVLKDHKNQDVVKMAQASYLHSVRRAAHKKGIVLPANNVDVLSNECTSINMVIGKNISKDVKKQLLQSVKEIEFTKIDINIIGANISLNGKH